MIKQYDNYNFTIPQPDGSELNLTFTLITWIAPDEEPELKKACKDRKAMNYYAGVAEHDERLCIYLANPTGGQ